jgi:two-component system phosphate regulon sensor histidine kinase PhoR
MSADITNKTRYRILLVEDDEVDRMVFEAAVRKNSLPYDYELAASVSEASALLNRERFDIVIVDYRLGDGTAFDVFNILEGTPTIFTTGAGDEETAIKAMKAGAYDYLVKDPKRDYLRVLPGVIKNAINHKINEDELKRYHENLERLVKERTEQLAEEKELLSVTLSSMSDGVIAVDVDKRIILFNRIAERLTGWCFAEVYGKKVDEFFRIVKENTEIAVEDFVQKALETGQMQTGTEEDCLVAKDGSLHPVSAGAAPLRRNDGAIVGVVIVMRDVTKEREVDQMKQNFISSVSHELRTPLSSIKAYTETILSSSDMSRETEKEYLHVIEKETERLTTLIESILEISSIEAGTFQIVRGDVNIQEVINRVLSVLKPLAQKGKIMLECDIPTELGILQGDESKIESVISNIVNNAIKFTPEGGRISVSAHYRGDELFFKVSDTGVGIPKESLTKIFDRFYRVYREGEQVQGTGLGLAIVKEIVQMHGGRIDVESEVGKGTTFTVVLPFVGQMQPHIQAVS